MDDIACSAEAVAMQAYNGMLRCTPKLPNACLRRDLRDPDGGGGRRAENNGPKAFSGWPSGLWVAGLRSPTGLE
eukprot:5504099-Pyramimonas_sp.AAC.1